MHQALGHSQPFLVEPPVVLNNEQKPKKVNDSNEITSFQLQTLGIYIYIYIDLQILPMTKSLTLCKMSNLSGLPLLENSFCMLQATLHMFDICKHNIDSVIHARRHACLGTTHTSCTRFLDEIILTVLSVSDQGCPRMKASHDRLCNDRLCRVTIWSWTEESPGFAVGKSQSQVWRTK